MELGKVINWATKFVQERVPFPPGEQIHELMLGDQVWVKHWKHDLLVPSWKDISVLSVNSVSQSCPTLCDPMNRSMPGLPVHHQHLEFTQTQVHQIGDVIQASHPLLSPSPPAPNPSQHQGLFQWVNSSHKVAKVFEFQLQYQSFQWTLRTDLL